MVALLGKINYFADKASAASCQATVRNIADSAVNQHQTRCAVV